MTKDELEEVLNAIKLAGAGLPNYEVLPDGSYYFYYGPKANHPILAVPESQHENDRYSSKDI